MKIVVALLVLSTVCFVQRADGLLGLGGGGGDLLGGLTGSLGVGNLVSGLVGGLLQGLLGAVTNVASGLVGQLTSGVLGDALGKSNFLSAIQGPIQAVTQVAGLTAPILGQASGALLNLAGSNNLIPLDVLSRIGSTLGVANLGNVANALPLKLSDIDGLAIKGPQAAVDALKGALKNVLSLQGSGVTDITSLLTPLTQVVGATSGLLSANNVLSPSATSGLTSFFGGAGSTAANTAAGALSGVTGAVSNVAGGATGAVGNVAGGAVGGAVGGAATGAVTGALGSVTGGGK